MQFFILCYDLLKIPRKFACYYIALILLLLFLLFSFTWRSQLVAHFLVHIIICTGRAGQGSCSQCARWAQGGKGLQAAPLQAEPCISSVPSTLCYCSCQRCSQNLFLAASTLKSFSLMVFLLFCLTCFCSSHQGLFVILMSSLCHYSSFASHEHFST